MKVIDKHRNSDYRNRLRKEVFDNGDNKTAKHTQQLPQSHQRQQVPDRQDIRDRAPSDRQDLRDRQERPVKQERQDKQENDTVNSTTATIRRNPKKRSDAANRNEERINVQDPAILAAIAKHAATKK